MTKYSSPDEKIALFRSLFRGREDVCALRYQNAKTGNCGYTPVCANKWKPGICDMPKVKCARCRYRKYVPLTNDAVFRHLSSKDMLCRDVIGIYPMLPDETTNFLVIDFADVNLQNCENHLLL